MQKLTNTKTFEVSLLVSKFKIVKFLKAALLKKLF